MLWRLFHDEEGQDIIEYALLASLISIAAIAAIVLIGPALVLIYEAIVAAL
ncbi:MAG: Flp family type IVb pilin [candidate division Zixibacteria bacterium]|nr:Flp family type IVb pilin [candidate division Zixibacteria bacterium]